MENDREEERLIEQQPVIKKRKTGQQETTFVSTQDMQLNKASGEISDALVKISQSSTDQQQTEIKEEKDEKTINVKQLIPLLQQIDYVNEKELFEKLTSLLTEMIVLQYEASKKYGILWKVVEIGNLIEILLPEKIKNEATANIFQTQDKNKQQLAELSNKQQWYLFKTCRNIVADGFYVLYGEEIERFYQHFTQLLQGQNIFNEISTLNANLNKYSRGKQVKKLGESADVREKLLNQMCFFLQRSKNFIGENNIKAAMMAFVAAGSCARTANIMQIFQKGTLGGGTMAVLSDARANLAHFTKADALEEQLNKSIQGIDPHIGEYIDKIRDAAKTVNCVVDIEQYIRKETEQVDGSTSSPRAYNRGKF